MVVNNHPRITEATKQRVQRVIKQAGYRPNRIAQSLSEGVTQVISMLIPSIGHALADPYFGELMSGICDQASRLDYEVMIHLANPEFIRERRHIELLERRIVGGVLSVGLADEYFFLKDFENPEYPMVVVNNEFPQWKLDCVVCDYRSGAEQVMTYLAQLGHQKIGLIHGSPTPYTSRVIKEVYSERIKTIWGESHEQMMADGLFTEEGGAAAAAQLLEVCPDLTGIFAGNDKMAIGAMHYLAHTGRSVPGDISVIGFDDLQHAAYVNPPLTTVYLPLYEIGSVACRRLIEKVKGEASLVQEKLATKLVLRESTSTVWHDGG